MFFKKKRKRDHSCSASESNVHLREPPFTASLMATRLIKASISTCFSLDVPMMMPKERFLLCYISCKLDQVYCAWLIKWAIKKRNYSVDWTVPYEMMNYKWYLMVLGQYMTILAGTWSVEVGTAWY